jgi:phosphoglycerol transferase MdoB-like AlkP superfamily enzyme
MASKPYSLLFFLACYVVVTGIAYHGKINPYPLGLLDTASVLFLFFGLLAPTALIFPRALLVFHILLISLLMANTFSSWFYFDYYQELYTLAIFAMGQDIESGTKAISFDPYGSVILSCVLFNVLSTYFGTKFSIPKRVTLLQIAAVSYLISGVGLTTVELSVSAYTARQIPWLHPANLHPIHALLSSEDHVNRGSQANKEAYTYFASLNKNTELPDQENLASDPENIELNVIIILLESFRADMTGHYGREKQSNTPNFDAIAKKHISARNYYSNTTHTISAELSIWCGIFDEVGQRKFTYQEESSLNTKCLPHIFNSQHHKSYYFHANSGSFYNRQALLPKIGFDHNYFHKDKSQTTSQGDLGWGIDDEEMFSIMMNELESPHSTQPFFAHMTTISNHYPFKWKLPLKIDSLPNPALPENNTLFENYQNATYYTDYALGRFWQRFEASPLYENTIVVILGDHGIWQFSDTEKLTLEQKNENFYRSPLAIYHPLIENSHEIEMLSSHIDILPTVVKMLNIHNTQNDFMGKDMMRNQPNSWAIMNKGADHIVRIDDSVCYFNIDQCEMNQQDCRGWRGDIIFKAESNQLVACSQLTGDRLKGGGSNKGLNKQDVFWKARQALEYQNSTSFGPTE